MFVTRTVSSYACCAALVTLFLLPVCFAPVWAAPALSEPAASTESAAPPLLTSQAPDSSDNANLMKDLARIEGRWVLSSPGTQQGESVTITRVLGGYSAHISWIGDANIGDSAGKYGSHIKIVGMINGVTLSCFYKIEALPEEMIWRRVEGSGSDCPPTTELRPDPREKFDAALKQGNDALSAERYDEAISNFEDAKELEKGSAEPYDGLRRSYAAKNDFSKAIQSITAAISRAPDDAVYYADRCNLYVRMDGEEGAEHADLAVEDATKALELKGDLADGFACRSKAYSVKGASDSSFLAAALSDAESATKYDPTYSNLVEDVSNKIKNANYHGPEELRDVEIVYFDRDVDEGNVVDTLKNMQVPYTTRPSSESAVTNSITCGSDVSMEAVRALAKAMLLRGVKIMGLNQSGYPQYPNRLVLESSEFGDVKPFTLQEISKLTSCSAKGSPNTFSLRVSLECSKVTNASVYVKYKQYGSWLGPTKYYVDIDTDVYLSHLQGDSVYVYAEGPSKCGCGNYQWPRTVMNGSLPFTLEDGRRFYFYKWNKFGEDQITKHLYCSKG